MKIEIYNDTPKKEDEPLRLKLKKNGNSVSLVVVNKQGGVLTNLLAITEDGELKLNSYVTPSLGLKLDSTGTLNVERY